MKSTESQHISAVRTASMENAFNWKRNWIFLLILVILALVVRIWATVDFTLFYDGCAYIMQAQNILKGEFSLPYLAKGQTHVYPLGYPALIAVLSPLINSFEHAAIAINIIFGSLLLIPIYLAARTLYDQESAIYSSALTVSFPLLVMISSNVYSEPGYLFFHALALWLSLRLWKPGAAKWAFFCGLSLGAAYLIRTQAIIGLVSLALILIAGWLILKRISFRATFIYGALALLGFAIIILPYLIYLHHDTGSITLGGKLRNHMFQKKYTWEDKQYPRWIASMNKAGTQLAWLDMAEEIGPLKFIRTRPGTYLSWVAKDFVFMAKEVIIDSDFTPFIILFPLLLCLIARRREEKQKARNVFLLCWYLPLPLIAPFTAVIFERYFVTLIIPLVLWAGGGLTALREEIYNWTSWRGFKLITPTMVLIFLILGAMFSFPGRKLERIIVKKDKQPQRARRAVAEWAEQFLPRDRKLVLMSFTPYTSLYTGNYWYLLPLASWNENFTYARHQEADYLLVDESTWRWLRLPEEVANPYFEPVSRPGLQYISSFKISEEEKAKYENTYVLYRVIPEIDPEGTAKKNGNQ